MVPLESEAECLAQNEFDVIQNNLTVSTALSLEFDQEISKIRQKELETEFTDVDTDAENVVEPKKKSLLKRIPCAGLILTVLKTLMMSLCYVVLKKIDLHPILLLFYRSFVIFSVSIPWSIAVDKPAFPPFQSYWFRCVLIIRGVIALTSAATDMFAIQNLNLGDFQMINALQPIFVSLSARLFLKESFGVLNIVSLVVMMAGVVLVIKPPFLFTSEETPENSMFWIAVGASILSKMVSANLIVILRYLRNQSIASLTASRETIIIIGAFIFIMVSGIDFKTPNTDVKLQILGLGVATLVSSNMNLVALKLEEANKVSFVERCVAILSAVSLDIYIFGEIPGHLTLIGIGLVMLALCLIGFKKVLEGKGETKFFRKNICLFKPSK